MGEDFSEEGEMSRGRPLSNENLLKQLMGKGYSKKQRKEDRNSKEPGPAPSSVGSKPRPISANLHIESDSDEGGRSSLGKSRQREEDGGKVVKYEHIKNVLVKASESEAIGLKQSQTRRTASKYLDEVLADRSLQKQRKSQRTRARNFS